MASKTDRQIRKATHRINREEEGIREAVKNCRKGLFSREGEWGLAEVLEHVGYSADTSSFDSDMLFELEHIHSVSKIQLLSWIEQSARVSSP